MRDGGADAEAAGDGEVAGFEGAVKIGLAHAENDQGDELKQQARSVEDEVDGDEPLEGQLQRERPRQSAEHYADPGHAAAVAPGDDLREHAFFGHGHGQAGVAHDQGVEHADAGDGAADDDGQTEQRAAERCARRAPSPRRRSPPGTDRRTPWRRWAECR